MYLQSSIKSVALLSPLEPERARKDIIWHNPGTGTIEIELRIFLGTRVACGLNALEKLPFLTMSKTIKYRSGFIGFFAVLASSQAGENHRTPRQARTNSLAVWRKRSFRKFLRMRNIYVPWGLLKPRSKLTKLLADYLCLRAVRFNGQWRERRGRSKMCWCKLPGVDWCYFNITPRYAKIHLRETTKAHRHQSPWPQHAAKVPKLLSFGLLSKLLGRRL